MLAIAACGEAIPTAAGRAATDGTPVPAPPTPSLSLTTPQVAATQTAFAAIPTRSDLSPCAPTIEATLSLPTPTYNPGPDVRPTVPIPTFPTVNPNDPCIIGVVGSSPGLQIQVPSSQIIIGTVTAVLPARWSTADGLRPPNPCGVVEPPFPYIYTPVRVTVEQVRKGSVSTTKVEFHKIGGTVGQDRRFNYNEIPIVEGQRAVMFIDVPAGPSISGRYIINPDGTATEALPPGRNVPLQQLLADVAALIPQVSPTPAATQAAPSSGP